MYKKNSDGSKEKISSVSNNVEHFEMGGREENGKYWYLWIFLAIVLFILAIYVGYRGMDLFHKKKRN